MSNHQHHQIVRPRSIEQLLQDNTDAQKDTAAALREVAGLLRENLAIGMKANELAQAVVDSYGKADIVIGTHELSDEQRAKLEAAVVKRKDAECTAIDEAAKANKEVVEKAGATEQVKLDKAIEESKVATSQPEHATSPAAKVATPEDKPVTIDDVKARIMTLMTGGHRDKAATVLKDHGASKMSEVKPEDYAAVVAALDAVIDCINTNQLIEE